MHAVGIIGTGQSAFTKSRSDVTYPELVREGAELALADAGVTMADVGAVVFPLAPDALIGVGNGERWCVEALGAQGKPFMRVNTGGATGLTAVVAGYVHVASGLFNVVLVAGATASPSPGPHSQCSTRCGTSPTSGHSRSTPSRCWRSRPSATTPSTARTSVT